MKEKTKQTWEEEFDNKANTFVGDGGWGCRTDNVGGIGIWPENYKEIKAFIKSLIIKEREEVIKEVEKMKVKRLYHWMNYGDIDGSNKFSQGIVDDHEKAPLYADGSSCEFVYNKAIKDVIAKLESIKKVTKNGE